MTVEVEPLEDPEAWNALVAESPDATPFHRHEFLQTAAEHAGATLYPLVGYKGQEPAGLFPLFGMRRGPVAAAFSPPPDLKMTYLGPALVNAGKLSRRKRERRNRDLVEGALSALEAELDPKFVHLRTGVGYEDPRPFLWNDFDPVPRYTYHVELDRGLEELPETFSRDARTNLRTDREHEIVEVGGTEAADLVERIRARHDEQGVDYALPPSFVADLHDRLPAGGCRTLRCERDGRVVGGVIRLADEHTSYAWQTWADHDADLPATDLLNWRLIVEASEAGREAVDLVGANDPRLSRFKAKYGPSLQRYTALRRSSRGMSALADLYDRFR